MCIHHKHSHGRKRSHEHHFVFLRKALTAHSRVVLHWELSMANSMRISTLLLYLARLRFSWPMTTIPSLYMKDWGWSPMAVELVDRPEILVVVRRFHGMGAVDSPSLHSQSCVLMQHFACQSTYVHFWRFWGDVRR
jgi:hypothetical protein